MTRVGDSGSGWSDGGDEPVADELAPDHPFRTEERVRYQRHDLLGAGGMGQVHAAWDHRLGREVALKTVAGDRDGPAQAARLARESWITARLEHPGIVPIYDAGHAADGSLFYSMRLIRGRSLAEALTGRDRPARLALLRDFLAFCHAVAYAHDHGVVHRDLKPANLMIGDFGDSTVVDWGLAVCVDDTLAVSGGDGDGLDAGRELGVVAAADAPAVAVGTPAYMSPEQASGGAPSRGSDVWSLGAVLYELVVGRPLLAARSAAEAAAQLGAGPALTALGQPGVPAELAAIVRKALALDPAARYPDASALSLDLAAYLDGRRVAAHAYRPIELLRRLARAWRVPLAIAGVGLLFTVGVFAVTWRRVLAERERAVVAERQTRTAMVAQQRTLGQAMVGWATNAHEAGASPEAEVIAAHALAVTDGPEARGVLAAAHGRARPAAATRTTIPGCPTVLASTDAVALCADGTQLRYVDRLAAQTRWALETPVSEVAVLADGSVAALRSALGLWILAAADGARLVEVPPAVPGKGLQVDPTGTHVGAYTASGDVVIATSAPPRWWRVPRPCEASPLAAFDLGPATLVAACADGRLVERDLATGAARASHRVPYAPPSKGVGALALDADGTHAVVGGIDGTLAWIDLSTGAVSTPVRAAEGAIGRVAFAAGHVLVSPDRGAPSLWARAGAGELMVLPGRGGVQPGAAAELVGHGAGRWAWRLPPRVAPWRFQVDGDAGLSDAAVSHDGRLLAVSAGDGAVTVWDRRDGQRLTRLALGPGVAKRVAFSPDDHLLAAASAGPAGVVVFDTTTWAPAPFTGGRPSRRVFFLADGSLVAFPYGDDVDVWAGPGPARRLPGPRILDATLGPPGDHLWLLTADERVVTWRAGASEDVLRAPGAVALAVGPDGALVATVHAAHVAVHDRRAGTTLVLPERSGRPLDLLISPDQRWVVAGTLSGTTDVWSIASGQHVAALRGHRERSAAGVMVGELLLTTSWDGTVRTWDLTVLDRSAAELTAAAWATWRLSLDDVVDLTPGTGRAGTTPGEAAP